MERFTKVEAVITKDGEIIPLFMLRGKENEDYYDGEIDLVYDKNHQTFTCDNTIEVFYDLLEKKVVSPYRREVTILTRRNNYCIGDKVAVEDKGNACYIDTIRIIDPGRLDFTQYVKKDEFDDRYKNEEIIKDEGDKDSPLVKVDFVCEKYTLTKGEVIDYDYKIKKIIEKK